MSTAPEVVVARHAGMKVLGEEEQVTGETLSVF